MIKKTVHVLLVFVLFLVQAQCQAPPPEPTMFVAKVTILTQSGSDITNYVGLLAYDLPRQRVFSQSYNETLLERSFSQCNNESTDASYYPAESLCDLGCLKGRDCSGGFCGCISIRIFGPLQFASANGSCSYESRIGTLFKVTDPDNVYVWEYCFSLESEPVPIYVRFSYENSLVQELIVFSDWKPGPPPEEYFVLPEYCKCPSRVVERKSHSQANRIFKMKLFEIVYK
eukprot:TRINITY_DN445_c0_g1_i2.p1 TRINITY_DN445_c0_g1~~TRINITY_DN445_c0_g1_i2.p1  ORF type:complete len:229 (-),score=10.72 TRINITY_DN445_c0_g1_i2:35-721(-)